MRILVLTDRFLPEIAAPSFRIVDHARYWLNEGHELTVVTCAPNFPAGKIFNGYANRAYQEEWIEGIRVIRVWSYMSANTGFVKRTLDQASFMCSAVALSSRYPDFDIILATSPPLFVALAGYLISFFSKRPWIFEIRDLWPASIKAVGLGKKVPLGFLEKMELFLYRKTDRIISLTYSFRENLTRRGIPSDKIDVVTNGVDTDLFSSYAESLDKRSALGFDEETFLVGYMGTVGMAHGLETLVDCAYLTRNNSSVRFIIMGQGSERRKLEQRVQDHGIDNVTFLDFVPHEEVPHYLGALDLFIVHLRPDPLFRTVIPSKIFESMAMGVPILHAVEGESATIVAESGAGVCIPSGDPQIMAETILRLMETPSELRVMGARGRTAALAQYGRRPKALACLASFEKVVRG